MGRIRVIILGACGRMGLVTVPAVARHPNLKLVGAVDIRNLGVDIGGLADYRDLGVRVRESLPEPDEFEGYDPVVAVDFTRPDVAGANTLACLERGYHVIVGTTGLDEDVVESIRDKAGETRLGVLIAPNFAIGAVLMMRFARIAAKYMGQAEIIEQHHDCKLDAPSGTALMTAQLIAEVQRNSSKEKQKELLKIQGVRGGSLDGVNIHSLRLPGCLAHHMVVFGDQGQTLTLRHDSINRECFMPGVLLALEEVVKVSGLIVGLEHLMVWD